MIFDQHSKIFKKFLRPLNIEEHVTNAANMHACKHHHPVLNERQAAQFFKEEATRKLKIEKKQWSSWEDEKPQLCIEVCHLDQQRMAHTLIQGATCTNASGDNEVANRPDHHEQVGAFWQLSQKTDTLEAPLRKDLGRARESSQDGQLWHIPDQVRAKECTFKHTD